MPYPTRDQYDLYPCSTWYYLGPSRALKKLYRQLAALDTRLEAIRSGRDALCCPAHAPTQFRVLRRRLREVEDQRYDVLRRILAFQNR